MLDRRLTTILPSMTLAEARETTRIHRVAGLTGDRTALVTTRPCRAPHHTISAVGLFGGGQGPLPGEGSRAHNIVLFLNERPEFRRHVLEVLRQLLEAGVIYRQSHGRPRPRRAGRISGTRVYRSIGSSPLPAQSCAAPWIPPILVDIGQCQEYRRAILHVGWEPLRTAGLRSLAQQLSALYGVRTR
jgi:hypothetical protein